MTTHVKAVLLVMLVHAPCMADVVKPKRGAPFQCQIIGYDDQKLTFFANGKKQTVPIASVDSFTTEAGRPQAVNNQPDAIYIASAEVGQVGMFPATLKVETAEDGRFIGSVGSKLAIVQGVNTEGLVTGKWVKLEQRMKVVGTENVSNGQTLFVLEPVNAAEKTVARSENPELSRPSTRPLRARDVRVP